ncbi:MAG: reprolysin-like metallopeptidase, partial [Saprospiraceae bacterium]
MRLIGIIFFLLLFSSFHLFGQITVNTQAEIAEFSSENGFESVLIDHSYYLALAKRQGLRSDLNISLLVRNHEKTFTATPNNVVDADFGKLYPDILTYDLKNAGEDKPVGSLTLSPHGLYAVLMMHGKLVSIYPELKNETQKHIIEYGQSESSKHSHLFCEHQESLSNLTHFFQNKMSGRSMNGFTIGEKTFEYKLAIVTTGEFYKNNGDNDVMVATVIVNTVNALNTIFNNELSVRFVLGSRIFLYKDPVTDPFTPDLMGGQSRTLQAGLEISKQFSIASYDIGHVFHQHANGDGWTGGGVARLFSVCDNIATGSGSIFKASAWSGSFTNVGNSWINLASHEFAHQFGATHTFNGSGASCNSAISSDNAVEIGSGTTIMSYNGICDASQNITNSLGRDNYFHSRSLEEIYQFIYTAGGSTCGTQLISPNALPKVESNPCNARLTIPLNTPFFIKAKGQFIDSDAHTYCWEQADEDGPLTPTQGKIGLDAAADRLAPLFRSYPPVSSPVRYFPSLEDVRKDILNPFDVLPTVTRSILLNVTMRDNNSNGGAVSVADATIKVENVEPFRVTKPVSGEIIQVGQEANFTWTNPGGVAMCSKVRIKASINGGHSYDYVLAEDVSYVNGSLSFTFPTNFPNTTEGKLMIECMDFDCFGFFNVSKGTFTIISTCTNQASIICPTTSISLAENNPGLLLPMVKMITQRSFEITKIINSTDPFTILGTQGLGGAGCTTRNVRYKLVRVYVSESGIYDFNLDGVGWVSIHSSDYNSNNACASFITSLGELTPSGGLYIRSKFTAELEACKEYVFIFFTFGAYYDDPLVLSVDNGPG